MKNHQSSKEGTKLSIYSYQASQLKKGYGVNIVLLKFNCVVLLRFKCSNLQFISSQALLSLFLSIPQNATLLYLKIHIFFFLLSYIQIRQIFLFPEETQQHSSSNSQITRLASILSTFFFKKNFDYCFVFIWFVNYHHWIICVSLRSDYSFMGIFSSLRGF